MTEPREAGIRVQQWSCETTRRNEPCHIAEGDTAYSLAHRHDIGACFPCAVLNLRDLAKAQLGEIETLRSALATAEREREEARTDLSTAIASKNRAVKVAEQAEAALATAREALAAILKAARGDEKSECWTIRKWLDQRGVFNDDIQGSERLIAEAARDALRVHADAPAARGDGGAQ